jgi:radical SAM protein with 4Fe4S-binding SPASM domain
MPSKPPLPFPAAAVAPRCADDDVIGVGAGAAHTGLAGDASGNRLISHVQEWAYANLVPLNVSIETTLDCNIRCLHCYNLDRDAPTATAPSDPTSASPSPNEGCGPKAAPLSKDEILGLMTDLRRAGCLFLSLTGGEVLLHPDLFAFLDHARELNLAVQLLSNGTLLRPGITSRLARYPNLLGVSLSLYGATPEVHDAITQVKGSWRRTWMGAERLRQVGIAVRLKFIIMNSNAHEVAAMRANAAERGYPYMIDLNITARHDGSTTSLATRISEAQLEQLYRGPLNDLVPRRKGELAEEDFPCNCARGNCAISATGDVYPCVSVPLPAGNIRGQSFQQIWQSSPVFQRIRGLKMADYPSCAPCPHKTHCTRDRGAAFTASGSYTGVDPFICAGAKIAHSIADAAVDQAIDQVVPNGNGADRPLTMDSNAPLTGESTNQSGALIPLRLPIAQ